MNIINQKNFNYTLYFYAILALMLPNIALCFTEKLPLWACCTNILLPLGIYTLLMSLCKKTGKMVWWCFILIFFAAFQLVLLYLFGKGVIAVDMFLNLVTTNPGEAMELLDNLVPAVAGVFIVYLPLLILGVVSIRSKRFETLSIDFRKKWQKYGCILSLVGLCCMGIAYLTNNGKKGDTTNETCYQAQLHLYPVNVFYNLILAVERNNASENYQQASAAFRFHATPTHPKDSTEIYVMVIGETARANNFSLYGYHRDTNPLLSKTENLMAFDHVTTQSNTTHKSVPMLLSAASARDFERLFHEKGILAAFKEAGFHTVFVSNQLPNHSFIDFLGQQADEWQFIKKGDKDNYYDADLLPIFDKLLSQKHKKLFVVLHTYGSHFSYKDRYPREMAYFKPDTQSDAKPENRRDLVNAYDNTIRHTDFVLHSIIQRLQKQGGMSAMLYTSDHGENIFDDSRKLFLHASPRASKYELHVPFIVWTSKSYNHQQPMVKQSLESHIHEEIQSSRSAFHTMLTIGGLSTHYLEENNSVASPKYKPSPLLYLNDHDKPIPQSECGFDK